MRLVLDRSGKAIQQRAKKDEANAPSFWNLN